MQRIAMIGLVLAALLLAMPGAAGAGAAPGPPRPAGRAAPAQLPPDRFSVDIIDHVTPGEIAAMHAAGVQMVRYYLSWGEAQPDPNQGFDWTQADSILGPLAA